MLVVGLTGNFGSGKSLVRELFRELGAATLDADEIVGGLLEDPMVLEKLKELLGGRVFNSSGKLSKSKVSDIIFSDAALRRSVEDVLHPLAFGRIDDALRGLKAEVAVVEVPLLFEGRYERKFHKTVAVYVDRETALRRLERCGVNRLEALRRLQAQMPEEEKARLADFVIDNRGGLADTRRQAEGVYEKLLALAREKSGSN